MSDSEQCLKLTVGNFSVARKPITNGGAIRPGGLLFIFVVTLTLTFDLYSTFITQSTHAVLLSLCEIS